MTNLWPRIEPLLARVEKPARYIGMERGSSGPDHRPGSRLLAPRLPRHLRDRAAQPGAPDPLRDPQRARRRGRRARLRALARPGRRDAGARGAAVLGRHPPRRRRLRRRRVQPLGRARLHERARVPRPRRRAGAGEHAPGSRPDRRRGRALRVQPGADGRLRRRLRHRRRRGGRRRDHRGGRRRGSDRAGPAAARACSASSRTIPGVYVPVDVRRRVRRRRASAR